MKDARLEHAAQSAHRAIDRILEARRKSAGPCERCRHSKFNVFGAGFCRNPLVAIPEFDPVRFKPRQYEKHCSDARSSSGVCGPEGALFESVPAYVARRITHPTWLQRIMRLLLGSDSDRSGEAIETGTGSTEGESAGRQASPK